MKDILSDVPDSTSEYLRGGGGDHAGGLLSSPSFISSHPSFGPYRVSALTITVL
jgi:hypothetical protein